MNSVVEAFYDENPYAHAEKLCANASGYGPAVVVVVEGLGKKCRIRTAAEGVPEVLQRAPIQDVDERFQLVRKLVGLIGVTLQEPRCKLPRSLDRSRAPLLKRLTLDIVLDKLTEWGGCVCLRLWR